MPAKKTTSQSLAWKKPTKAVTKTGLKRTPRKKDVEGLKAAKAATTMTSEQWKKLQVGMAKKWPAPAYMQHPHPDGKGHTCYRDETFEIVTRFMKETKIAYRPHAKSPGSKSHVRYEEYMKATTVGQALKLGSWPVDWCWDFERGYIKVVGPLRDEPLDVLEVSEDAKLTDVDKAVMVWYRRELAKKYGLSYKDLLERGTMESTMMRAHRMVAQRESKRILEECRKKKRTVSDEDLEMVLGYWGFARNMSRLNVMKQGVKWVWSDTLGLLRDRMGDIHITSSSLNYPEVVEVMSRWLTARLPAEAKQFSWTSLNVNKNYSAKIHRDGNNFGPSMISAFGEFSGGELNYYAHDDASMKVEELEAKTSKKASKLDLKGGLVLFNGNSAHSVDAFKGTRYSIVYFTLGCHKHMKKEDREKLEGMGVVTPKTDEDPYKIIRAPLMEKAGRPSQAGASLPAHRYWKKSALAAGSRKRKAKGGA